MYSVEFMRFLIGRDADDYMPKKENVSEKHSDGNMIYRYSKLATVPIEIKK